MICCAETYKKTSQLRTHIWCDRNVCALCVSKSCQMIQDIVVKLAQAVIIASGPSHNISQEKMEIFAHSQNKIMK